MNVVFEKITQPLSASQQVRLDIAGNFFRLSACDWPVSVSLLKSGRVVGTMAGMLAGDYVRDFDFDGVIIDNGATSQTVAMQIAGGGAGTDRVLGEVSVIDGGKSRTYAGMAFTGYGSQVAVAGEYSLVQLRNTDAGNKKVIVTQVECATLVRGNGYIYLTRHATALATSLGGGLEKRGAAASAIANVRRGSSPSIPGTGLLLLPFSVAGERINYRFTEPLVLNAGEGIVATSDTVNSTLLANFEWNEESL